MINNSLRKLCPNLDKEGGLDTVLEVPIPEEMYTRMGDNITNNIAARWNNMRNVMRATQRVGIGGGGSGGGGGGGGGPMMDRVGSYAYLPPSSNNDQFMLLLKLVGSALVPSQVQCDDDSLTMRNIDPSIEISTAKYIVQQYLAATGGLAVLSEKTSMYAVGQVEMTMLDNREKDVNVGNITEKSNGDVGGFVLWQKNPDLWYLELVVSGFKISGGSDGKVSWNQSSSNSVVSKGPPRPLRRFFQGLDPRSTAHLFLNAGCIGEKKINDEDCFILKHETSSEVLKLQSTTNTEVVRHTIWGYFSQRSGLLIQFEDTKLVRMKNGKGDESVFWETSMESILEDYRYIEGINIAHRGKTSACIYRYGDKINTKWRLQETWNIEEVDFNICGLSMDCFLSPADDVNKKEKQDD
ncbi:hypothetical protein Leryth_022209 [Lithospermum erythrorhizon]|nr:hypothetical protein Leryth_022209 [Lithospermum erythrorhizon]